MTTQANQELLDLQAKAETAQTGYDAAHSAVQDGETYAKSLETEYREALSSRAGFDRLIDLQAKRNAVSAVLADLEGVYRVAGDEKDDADEALRHEKQFLSE